MGSLHSEQLEVPDYKVFCKSWVSSKDKKFPVDFYSENIISVVRTYAPETKSVVVAGFFLIKIWVIYTSTTQRLLKLPQLQTAQ